jgi:hypothetical protein
VTKKPDRISSLARRADLLLSDAIADGPDDGQLTTKEVAQWFRCSTQLLEKMRKTGTGPRFKNHGPRMIRYSRGDCKKFLEKLTYQSTADYPRKTKTGARVPDYPRKTSSAGARTVPQKTPSAGARAAR